MRFKYTILGIFIYLNIIVIMLFIGWHVANSSYWMILNYPLEPLCTCCLDDSYYCIVDDFRESTAFTCWIMYGLYCGFIGLATYYIYSNDWRGGRNETYI